MSAHSPQVQQVRQALVSRRNLLRERYQRVERDLARQNDPLVADSGDQAIQKENDEPLQVIEALAASEIAAIDVALQRLDVGLYGVCQECAAEIEAGRLVAVPHATTCRRCATK